MLYYNARFYLPGIGRFASADTIVPNPARPQAFNRYSYTLGNPIKLVDPSGHNYCDAADDCKTQPYTPSPNSPEGVEYGVFEASGYLQALLQDVGITQGSFRVPIHSNNRSNNPDLFRHEIGAWTLIQEQKSFHPLNYDPGSANEEHFSKLGLYTSIVLLQVIQSREDNYSNVDLFKWIQENPNSGQFAYPPPGVTVNEDIYNDFLIIAYLVEQGALPDTLATYPDTITPANPSGRPIFYGHYNLIEGVGEYANGRDSLSVSSWAWAETDWVPTMNDWYKVANPRTP